MGCKLCGQDKAWHEENKPRHPFQEGDEGAGKLNSKEDKKNPVQVQRGVGQGDVVLRLALIDAGVIQYEHLVLAEEQLDAARTTGRPVFLSPRSDSADGPDVSVDPGGVPADPGPGDRGGA